MPGNETQALGWLSRNTVGDPGYAVVVFTKHSPAVRADVGRLLVLDVGALKTAGAAVAALASLAAVVTAASQMATRSRLRRTIELVDKLRTDEDSPDRLQILGSIRDVATARIVGYWLVPWRHFLEVVTLVFIDGLGGFSLGRWSTSRDFGGLMMTLIGNFFLCTVAGARMVRMFRLRQEVASAYLARRAIDAPALDFVSVTDSRTTRDTGAGALLGLAIVSAAAAIGLAVRDWRHPWWLVPLGGSVCALIWPASYPWSLVPRPLRVATVTVAAVDAPGQLTATESDRQRR